MQRIPMTAGGFSRLQEELKHLKTIERIAVIKAISEARALGDLSENAEYHAARERQGFIEGRIAELEAKLSLAEVIEVAKLKGDIVRFGASVKLIDEETEEESIYQIVGVDESDIKKGFLSISAPLARSLIGKKTGDSVEVHTPGGSKTYEIISVEFV
jgi:transcription elongation factor GreA